MPWKCAGTEGSDEGVQSSQHDTSRDSDLLEQRQELPGPFLAAVPLHRRVLSRPARVGDSSALCGQQPGCLLCLSLVWERTVSGLT